MKKRKTEANWIESQNRWQINVSSGGKRRSFYSSNPTRAGKLEAERKADDWLTKRTDDGIKFGAAYESFIDEKKIATSKDNIRQLLTFYNNWFAHLKDFKLSKITSQDWQDVINAAYKKGRSKKTCKGLRGAITNFYSYCLKNRWEIEAPIIDIPKDAPVGEKKILKPNELRTLFTNDTILVNGKAKSCFYIHCWRFMVVTGLRRGEALGIQLSDIQSSSLQIVRSVNENGYITAGKTDNAKRKMSLPPIALKIIEQQIEMLKSYGIESEWLFPSPSGEQPSPNYVYNTWKEYRDYFGIESSLHGLRHTMISYTKSEVPIETLKLIVGHSASMDTTGVYGHEVEGELSAAADTIQEVFSKYISGHKEIPKETESQQELLLSEKNKTIPTLENALRLSEGVIFAQNPFEDVDLD